MTAPPAGSSRPFATSLDTNASPSLLPPSLDHLDSSKTLPGYRPASANGRRWVVFEREIGQSPSDDRQYRLIRLANGLEALLISDPTIDKAAAALSVRVGHLSDPEELQGLAHFCEHLLFMGTQKYPRENDYNEYLSANSGQSNAFTGMDQTTYFFDVHPEALDGALDRFSQFFIAPLFDPSCTEREIQAVDSENKKNLQSDMWRLYQLEKSLSSRQHAYWRFGTGNLETLWTQPKKQGLDVREELLKFHRRHYSANLMKLAVIGTQSLDEMTAMVVERLSDAEDKNLPAPAWPSSPYSANELKQLTLAKTVKDQRSLELLFPIPDQDPLFAAKPGHYLSHFIGHEGEGSILSFLKRQGWANHLGAGPGGGASGFDLFRISIDLTKEGLEHYEAVAQIVFRYIELLKSTPPQDWAFKEVQMLGEIGFRFQDKERPSSYVTHLVGQLHKPYPREWLLSAPHLWRSFDRDQIAGAISHLDINNCRITISSQQPLPGFTYDQKERWYGTHYTIRPMPSSLLEAPTQVETGLSLPQPNSFVPSNLDILGKKKVDEPLRRPNLLRETPVSRVWHKKDDRWWLPRATSVFLLRAPTIDDTADHAVCSRLFADLVNDALTEYSYDADVAGLNYALYTQNNGILLSFGGYNDKLPVLVRTVVQRLKGFRADPKRFEIIKEQLQRGLENFRLSNPYQHSAYLSSYLTTKTLYLPETQLEALHRINVDSLQQYVDTFLQRARLETLVFGNIVKDDALQLAKQVEETLRIDPLPKTEELSPRCLLLPRGSNIIYRKEVPNPEQLNSAVDHFIYVGDDANQAQRVRLQLLAQLASEPCFDQLRTKEQLGYIVQSSVRGSVGMQGFRIIVQSERDADFVEDRVERWLVQFRQYVEDMTDDEFAKQRASLVNRKMEDYKNMGQESDAYWLHIHSGYYDFGRKRSDAAEAAKLTKGDVLKFIDDFILPTSPSRAKLSVHMRSQRINEDAKRSLRATFQSSGLTPPPDLETLLETSPTYSDLVAFMSEQDSYERRQDVVAAIEKLRDPPAPQGVQLIESTETFRSSLEVGPPARPSAEFHDWLAKL